MDERDDGRFCGADSAPGDTAFCSSSSGISLTLGRCCRLLREGSGLLLLLRIELAYCGSNLFRSSGTSWLRVAVGDGNVDLDDGVSGVWLEPTSDGT
jgi:hypothetical protein